MVQALERAYEATGDPVFDDALRAFRSYGFDRAGVERAAKRAEYDIYGDPDQGYFVQMRWLLEHPSPERRAVSDVEAAEQVAADFFPPGRSFDSVVERLRTGYSAWRRKDYPDDETVLMGDLGYLIAVVPTSGRSAPLMPGGGTLPAEGSVQPAISWWRRLFREGAINVRFVQET